MKCSKFGGDSIPYFVGPFKVEQRVSEDGLWPVYRVINDVQMVICDNDTVFFMFWLKCVRLGVDFGWEEVKPDLIRGKYVYSVCHYLPYFLSRCLMDESETPQYSASCTRESPLALYSMSFASNS